MTTTNLKNITVKKLEDRNFKPYYLIVNNDNSEEAFFCFEGTVKSGWDSLVDNWENIREVEIEFEEINKIINSAEQQKEQNFKTYRKVVSLWTNQEGEIFV